MGFFFISTLGCPGVNQNTGRKYPRIGVGNTLFCWANMPRIPVDCPNKIICIQYDLAHFFLKKYSVTITSIHLSILFSVSHRFPNKNIHGGHLCQAKSSSSSASSASRAEQSTRQWLPAMHAMQWAAASAASASAAGAWVEPVSPPFHLKSGG